MSGINDKYNQLGGSNCFLGEPRNEECVCPDGVGHFRHYQGGSIYWRPGIGAFEVHGAILTKWSEMGWERSSLGYPTTDESTTPDGVGHFNHFERGSIYWTPQSQAHAVEGPFRDKWEELGWERGFLGYPISDQTEDECGWFTRFQGGCIYWSAGTPAHEVHGAIFEHYLSLGGGDSYLGHPMSDELSEGNAKFNKFERGRIYWTSRYGAADTPTRVHGGRVYTGLEGCNLNWRDLRDWTAASPTTYLYRRNVVKNAFIENELGLHMPEAAARYCSGGFPEGTGGWCSELAHYILLMNYGGVHNIGTPVYGDLGDAYTVGEFKNIFASYNLWVPYEKINAWTIEPGDYLSTQNGNHSTIVVGVKWDRSQLWTVERLNYSPDNDYVGFHCYPYVDEYGVVNTTFYGVGKLHFSIVDQAACTVQPIPLKGPDAAGDIMWPGQVLRAGQSLTSANGQYSLEYQTDCNLVLYRVSDRRPMWASQTQWKTPAGAIMMQPDGNLVMYDTVLNFVWDTGVCHPNSHLIVQDDGNVAIYRPDNQLVWAMPANIVKKALPTGPIAAGDDMQPGEVLKPGQSITSLNGEYTFIYQVDGNLVLYRNQDGRPLWDSHRAGMSTGVCIMQTDGNLVIYNGSTQSIWDTDTENHHGARLKIQDDGNVVIYHGDNPIWSTDTHS